jgi:hypothetical protein
MSRMHTLTHELKQVALVTLYFLCWFGLVLLLKKLFLAEYRIEVYALSAAVIGALVAGKIVVILDKTRRRHPFRPAQWDRPRGTLQDALLCHGDIRYSLGRASSSTPFVRWDRSIERSPTSGSSAIGTSSP